MIVLHDLPLYLYANAFRRSGTCGKFLEERDPVQQLIRRRMWLEEQHFMVHCLLVPEFHRRRKSTNWQWEPDLQTEDDNFLASSTEGTQ
jgi:hypothetical protein